MQPVREKWDKNTRIYHLGGSGYKLIIREGQNYFNRQTGQYEEVDLNPKKESNWEFEYAVKSNNFAAYFNDATDPVNPTLAGVEIVNKNGAARWINYKIHEAAPTSIEVTNNKVIYRGCWPGVDCEYIVSPEKLKFNVIFASQEAVKDVVITLKESPGMNIRQEKDGDIIYEDTDTKEELWRIEAPYFFEQKKIRKQKRRNVKFKLGQTRRHNGADYKALSFEINGVNWLSQAEYPLVLDPTTNVGQPGKDKLIYKQQPDSVDNDLNELLLMNYWYGTAWDTSRLLFQFDMSALPANASIMWATLYLFWFSQDASKGKTISYAVKRLTRSDWLENEVTWNSYKTGSAWTTPGGDTTDAGKFYGSFSSDVDYPNAWLGWPIDDIAKNIFNEGKRIVDVLFKAYAERGAPESGTYETPTGYQFFHDRAYSDVNLRPYLEILYWLTYSSSFTAGAAVVKRYVRSFTANAIGRKTVSKTFNAYSLHKKTANRNFTASAVFRKTLRPSFSADAIFQNRWTKPLTIYSTLRRVNTNQMAVNSTHKRLSVQGSFLVDSQITKIVSGGFSSHATLKKTDIIKTFKASAAVIGQGASVFFDQAFVDLSVTAKADLTVNVTRSITWEVSTVT
ncbi:MAG: DNRLRE domain-containing protein [Peptococcaceae bacterium]|nr:DNRLRE domain-containing protein [Peptococcaceae bacterium]